MSKENIAVRAIPGRPGGTGNRKMTHFFGLRNEAFFDFLGSKGPPEIAYRVYIHDIGGEKLVPVYGDTTYPLRRGPGRGRGRGRGRISIGNRISCIYIHDMRFPEMLRK